MTYRGLANGLILIVFAVLSMQADPASASMIRHGVPTVVSGDEVVVDGVPFRFRVADAFELGQQCWTARAQYDCGAKARDALKEIIAGGSVVCGGSSADLAACWTREKVDLPEEMIRRGWALARPDLALDVKEATKLCEFEAQAKRLQRGVWGGGYSFGLPYLHRGEKGKTREQVSCGNVRVIRP